ncbi:MAG TPA: hypothetical protein VL737_00220 [Candidatus Pristimantibacillus sp.]|nr:hypothetical protein [Candidatus Pristimantibacillus sp.]
MSNPDNDPGGNSLDLAAMLKRCELVDIQRHFAGQLSGATVEEAYRMARDRFIGLFALPDLAICRVVLFEDADQATGRELGGGMQFEFEEVDGMFGLTSYGLRVPVYCLEGIQAMPINGFRDYQSDEVARSVLGIAEKCLDRSIGASLDLTRLASEPQDRMIFGLDETF